MGKRQSLLTLGLKNLGPSLEEREAPPGPEPEEDDFNWYELIALFREAKRQFIDKKGRKPADFEELFHFMGPEAEVGSLKDFKALSGMWSKSKILRGPR